MAMAADVISLGTSRNRVEKLCLSEPCSNRNYDITGAMCKAAGGRGQCSWDKYNCNRWGWACSHHCTGSFGKRDKGTCSGTFTKFSLGRMEMGVGMYTRRHLSPPSAPFLPLALSHLPPPLLPSPSTTQTSRLT